MNIDLGIYQVLSNPSITNIFKKILQSRVLSRYQLELQESYYNKEEIDTALKQLVENGLIDKQSRQIQHWDKYYPTQQGLSPEKVVR